MGEAELYRLKGELQMALQKRKIVYSGSRKESLNHGSRAPQIS